MDNTNISIPLNIWFILAIFSSCVAEMQLTLVFHGNVILLELFIYHELAAAVNTPRVYTLHVSSDFIRYENND